MRGGRFVQANGKEARVRTRLKMRESDDRREWEELTGTREVESERRLEKIDDDKKGQA